MMIPSSEYKILRIHVGFCGVYYTGFLWGVLYLLSPFVTLKETLKWGYLKRQLKMWSEVLSFLLLVLASFKFLILAVTQNRHALPNPPKSSQILLKKKGKPRFWQNQWIGMLIFCSLRGTQFSRLQNSSRMSLSSHCELLWSAAVKHLFSKKPTWVCHVKKAQ